MSDRSVMLLDRVFAIREMMQVILDRTFGTVG